MRVVSFDFDWTLRFPDNGDPCARVVKLARWLLKKGRKVFVVTSRSWSRKDEREIREFLEEQGLSGVEIHFTNGSHKAFTLNRLGVQHHFDDDEEELEACRSFGVQGHNVWTEEHQDR